MAVSDSTNLRSPPNRFIGRDQQLDHLTELVTAGQRLITVFGPAGTGKTRTALALGERLLDELSELGGVWLCELAAVRDLEGLCETIARTLGVPPLPSSSDEEAVQRLGAAIAGRGPLLLVLDNFEQLVELAPTTVAVWLAEAPELRLVVTSREHLRLRGELRFELPPLTLPVPGQPPQDSEAVALLVERIQSLDPGFVLDEASTPRVVDLVTRLEGLPLAIELAAPQVELLGLQGLIDNLHKRLDVLVGDGRDVESRHATLRAAIEWSWSLLDPGLRDLLAQCTVFHGGFTAEAAAAVLVGPDDGVSAVAGLKSLRAKSLLRRDEPGDRVGLPRLSLFDAVREFAAERFASPDAHAQACARHAQWYLAQAEQQLEAIGTPRSPDALHALAVERGNLLAVHKHAMQSAATDDVALEWALRCVLALDTVAGIRGSSTSHLALLEQTVGLVEDRSIATPVRVRALRARSKARLMQGQTAAANRDLESALLAARDEPALQAEVQADQGMYHHQRRELDRAQPIYEQALEHARAAGARAIEGRVLGNLGALCHDRHELGEARRIYHEALELLRAEGDARFEAIHVCNLGVLELEHGEADRARAHFDASRELLSPLGDRRLLAIVLGNLGTLEHMQGQLQAARQCHDEALTILREVGDRRSEALCLSRLGRATAALGWAEDAGGCLSAAGRLLGRFPDPMVEATVRLDRGFVDVALAAKGGDEAAGHLRRARERIAEATAAQGDVPAWVERCDDIRFAVQLLEQALKASEPSETTLPAETPASGPSARNASALLVGEQGRWLQLPGGDAHDLRRRKALRLILVRLAEEHRAKPGAGLPLEALLEAGWPGERVMPSAGANRVYVALTALRKLGLRKALLSQEDGYLLDPALPIERVASDWDERPAASPS
ncbi:MAG: tetratricopeptide repeat protein [Deltaproteobacteria bacterium]|nr:tetratricopeptide repeat protein [Deltaproteobacteria bacterium]